MYYMFVRIDRTFWYRLTRVFTCESLQTTYKRRNQYAQLVWIIQAIDFGDYLPISIVWTIKLGDFLLTGIVRKLGSGYCLLIGIARTIDLEGGLFN